MSQEGKKNEEKEPKQSKWNVWTSLFIESVLIIITVFSFCETQKSTQSAQISAKAAQDALALQQRQYEDSKGQEKLRSIEESEKRKKDIELIQQQILALKTQASALERGVKNTEISQAPFLDIVNFGFHYTENNRIFCYYEVKNYGVRPAYLTKVKGIVFDTNFKKMNEFAPTPNGIIIAQKTAKQPLRITDSGINNRTIDENKLYDVGNLYFCFYFEYRDVITNSNINTKNNPIFFKWTKKEKTENYIVNGPDKYFPFDACNTFEQNSILEAIKNDN